MQAREEEPQLVVTAPAEEDVADPFREAAVGQSTPRLRGLTEVAPETAPDMLEAEDALRLLRDRFEHTEDPQAQGELAVQALDQVERQLSLARGRRQQLDSIEGQLWARRNRLERFLIHTRGLAWWHARRKRPRPEGLAPDRS
jgi:hypothetical protein